MRRPAIQLIAYGGIFVGALAVCAIAGALGTQIDNSAYDWMFRFYRPRLQAPESILLTVDEPTLVAAGGMRHVRSVLARGLEQIAPQSPRAVAIDLILADAGDGAEDAALESAFRKIPRLVLSCDLVEGGAQWEEPLARFRQAAAAVGHVHADPGPLDGTSRQIPLEKASGHHRCWALALETYRLSRALEIVESPGELQIGETIIRSGRQEGRPMRVRYLPPALDGTSPIPRISFLQLQRDPSLAARFRNKVVFVGVTAQSAVRDRLMTPYSDGVAMPGVEIHANAFETLAQGQILRSAPAVYVVAFCVLLAACGVLAFALRSGWQAYVPAGLVLASAHIIPYALFTHRVVMPYVAPVSAAWISVIGAGTFQFISVRRQLRRTETEKTRYQQAMHFVTHEMRTPLTAIQGSSELMSRYNLSEEKRRQIADLINSESKRLARMVETFLNVERLSAGQMQLKTESIAIAGIVDACVRRALPLAERKQIRLNIEQIPDATITGDRELMEYAIYNLLTNAVKYSPQERQIWVSVASDGGRVRISVKDQGIGMDQQEVRRIFQKFYRTRSAVASGEAGTGIGLSIVDQIVTHHGGRIEVVSAPGKGSCFTVVLPLEKTVSGPVS